MPNQFFNFKKRNAKTIFLSLLLSGLALFDNSAFAARFVDVLPDNWAEVYINSLSDRDIIKAEDDGQFHPDDNINRITFAKWLVGILGLEKESISGGLSFSDLSSSNQDFKYAAIAVQNKFMSAAGGSFQANSPMQKSEAVEIIARAMKKNQPNSRTTDETLERFSDQKSIPQASRSSYALLASNDILVNHPDPAVVNATQLCTKADAAALLYKFDQFFTQEQIAEAARRVQSGEPAKPNKIAKKDTSQTQATNNNNQYQANNSSTNSEQSYSSSNFGSGSSSNSYSNSSSSNFNSNSSSTTNSQTSQTPVGNEYYSRSSQNQTAYNNTAQTPYGSNSQQNSQPYSGQQPYGSQAYTNQNSYQQNPYQQSAQQGQAQYNQGMGSGQQFSQNSYGNSGFLQGAVAVINAGTQFGATLKNSIDSDTTQPGEEIQAVLSQALLSGSTVVVPAGSRIIGQVTNVVSARRFRFGANGQIAIKFTAIETPDGRRFPLSASIDTNQLSLSGGSTGGRVGKSLGTVGIGAVSGAALGTALGAIVGATSNGRVGKATGMGAVFGTAIGGGVGAVGAGVRKGSEVRIKSGTSLPITLDQALQISTGAPTMPPQQPYYGQPQYNNPYGGQQQYGNPYGGGGQPYGGGNPYPF